MDNHRLVRKFNEGFWVGEGLLVVCQRIDLFLLLDCGAVGAAVSIPQEQPYQRSQTGTKPSDENDG